MKLFLWVLAVSLFVIAERKVIMKREAHIIIGICFIFLCASIYLFYAGRNKSAVREDFISSELISSENETTENRKTETSDSSGQEKEAECAVYVAGAVKSPGIYRYTGMARIQDAIEAVGGFKENAAKDFLNLAKLLEDGEKIVVPTKKQAKKLLKKQEHDSERSDLTEGENTESKVNINLATKEELMTLPGIGEAKAEMIITYRTEQGGFKKPEDIMQISGIKEGVYNKIKDKIRT